ncbi:MAG TPA: PA14 domain-containing protein [Tepidisphaeraceae bacterium]|jgi:hypothetical protein|nr:PA14 domain-containing protein [Tepidisphaeraceae bacterium]
MRRRLLTQIGGLITICAIFGLFALAAMALPATRPTLQHVPDEPSQSRAQRMVREVFGRELASQDPEQRRALAQKLIAAAMESGDDAAARFVLLKEARDVSAGAGDAFGALRAIALMCRFYAIDQAKLVLAAMNGAQAAASSTEALAAVVQVSLNAAEMAILEDDFPTATKLMSIAESAAAKAKSSALAERVKEKSRLLQALSLEFDAVAKAREALKRDAEDADACARVGRYLCLYKGDWSAGLPLLAMGTESALKKPAQEDLVAAGDGRKRLAAGDGWWELSVNQAWLAKKNSQGRAAFWYRQVVGELGGIHRSIVEKRIEAVELAALAEQNLVAGMTAELFKGMEFKQLVRRRVDDQINFDWGTDAPDATVGKDNFAIRWTGVIRPPMAGNYELVVLANAGAKLWVDEKLVLENGNLARSRNGVRVVAKLDQPLHAIRVEFWDSSGAARMKLLWRRPGTVKDEVIPASAFFHEGLVEGQ